MSNELNKVFFTALENIDNRRKFEESLKTLQDLADNKNYLPAIRRLGVFYGYEYSFIEQDFKKSTYYLNRAFRLGDNYSIHVLGRINWYRGNTQKAIECFESGYKNNYLPSVYWLAWALENNSLPSFNEKRSLALYEKAAQQGHVHALGSYIKKILKGKYGIKKIFKVPFLFIKALYLAFKSANDDQDDLLIN